MPPFRAVALWSALLADVGPGKILQCVFIDEPTVGYFDRGQFSVAKQMPQALMGNSQSFGCLAGGNEVKLGFHLNKVYDTLL